MPRSAGLCGESTRERVSEQVRMGDWVSGRGCWRASPRSFCRKSSPNWDSKGSSLEHTCSEAGGRAKDGT